MKKKTSIISMILFGITILANYLISFNFIPGVLSQKYVSDKYPTPITPASFTFSIWRVIYILLVVALIYFLIKGEDKGIYSEEVEKAAPALWVMFIANILWNLLFGLEYIVLSTVVIIIYAISIIYFTKVISNKKYKLNEVVPIEFGLHAGWITVASIVNIYASLSSKSATIFANQSFWIMIGLIIAFILAFIVSNITDNAYVPLPIAWAFWGIKNNEVVKALDSSTINIMAIVLMVILIAYTIKKVIDKRKLISN